LGHFFKTCILDALTVVNSGKYMLDLVHFAVKTVRNYAICRFCIDSVFIKLRFVKTVFPA